MPRQPVRGSELRGFGFPIAKGREGYWSRRGSDALCQTAIMMVVGTSPGERVGEPDFGSLIPTLLFEPNDVTTLQLARRYVMEALAKWAPILEVVNVVIEQDENGFVVFVDYRNLGGGARDDEPRRAAFPVKRG